MVVSFIAGLVLVGFIVLVYVAVPIAIGSFIKGKLESLLGKTAATVLGAFAVVAVILVVFQYLPMEYNQPYDR